MQCLSKLFLVLAQSLIKDFTKVAVFKALYERSNEQLLS